ncbi:MAG: radical SAM protein [Candidatus Omnitrophica bacterium]|nr:radical SAM protein [Candidatus Omnitrophota bacterium]
MKKRKILFLQLPRLDNDTQALPENIHLAAAYLKHALNASKESAWFKCLALIKNEDTLDDRHLLKKICLLKPSVICATLYLWNIQRTLGLQAAVKKYLPEVKIIVGGAEAADKHPFLFKNTSIDVIACQEGEIVFPLILNSLRRNKKTDISSVFWREGKKFVKGKKKINPYDINKAFSSLHTRYCLADKNGLACVETVRGCPLSCSYCAYGGKRKNVSYLNTEKTLKQINSLIEKDAKEIRFVDPAFNANPYFKDILLGLTKINKDKKVKFFAELWPKTITEETAKNLAKANFAEIEIGIQSKNKNTLKLINRPYGILSADKTIRHLIKAGIRPTVDLMYGLPGQKLSHIKSMLKWASAFKKARIQCLQTLLLPGTKLRQQAKRYGIKTDNLPPYQVNSTPLLSAEDMQKAETLACRMLKIENDTPAKNFTGRKLADLFKEQLSYDIPITKKLSIKGKTNRRAVIFKGEDFFTHRSQLKAIINLCLKTEPYILWQFVLELGCKEPLDLIYIIAEEIKKFPFSFQDRFIQIHSPGKTCSRRVFILLKENRRFSQSWQNAAEKTLKELFF